MSAPFSIAFFERLARGEIELLEVQQTLAMELVGAPQSAAELARIMQQARAQGLLSADEYAALARQLPAGTDPPAAVEGTAVRGREAFRPSEPAAGTRLRRRPDPPMPNPPPTPPSPPTDTNLDDPHQWTGVWGEPLAVGDVLSGRYRLERLLGQGGMGDVYLAFDQVEEERFAIKVLNQDFRGHEDSLKSLKEEVRKSRELAHPNIVGVYQLNRDRTHAYMVMEYLEGKPLDRLLEEDFARGMPLQQALPIIRGVGAALAYAHDRGIVHSDVKPSNIFVLAGGNAKVLDFGIARAVRGPRGGRYDASELGALTPAYASLEMIDGQPPDARDDIYALACVAYELITGRHPFGGDDAQTASTRRGVHGTPDPVPGLSRGQQQAFVHALTFRRADRTPSVEAFLDELAHRKGPAGLPISAKVLRYASAGAVGLAIVVASVALLGQPDEADAFVEYLRRNPPPRGGTVEDMQRQIRLAQEDIDLAADPSTDSLGLLCNDAPSKLMMARGVEPENEQAISLLRASFERILVEAERARDAGDAAAAREWARCGLDLYPDSELLRDIEAAQGGSTARR